MFPSHTGEGNAFVLLKIVFCCVIGFTKLYTDQNGQKIQLLTPNDKAHELTKGWRLFLKLGSKCPSLRAISAL